MIHFDIVTIKMKPCLICYANCDPHPGENEAPSDLSGTRRFREEILQAQSQSLISKQVDTIFILRKLFEVPLTHLELFLQNEGNPEDWISLCGTCKESTERARKIYEGILEAKEKFREIRKDIAATVRSTFQWPIRKGISFVSVGDECRRLLKDQKIDDTKKDFAVGDHQADEHLKRLTILKYKRELVEPKVEQNLDSNEYSEDHLWNPIPEDTYSEDPDFSPSQNKEDEDDPLASSSDEESRYTAEQPFNTISFGKTNSPKHKDFRKRVRPIKCTHCTATFLRKKTLEAHVKNRHSGEKVTYFKEKSCPQCELTFASQHSLDKHFKHVHLRQSSADSSEVVKKSFTKTNLPKHKDFRKPVRAMKCDHCTATFLRRTRLEAHVKLRHSSITGSNNGENEEVTDFGEQICPHCELSFASQHTLDKHVKHVHLRQSSAASSEVAKKSFTKTNLPKHKDFRKPVHPIKCSHCTATFLRKTTLEAHVKLRHSSITDSNGENKEAFEESICPHCELTFASQWTLDKHVKCVHLRQFIASSSDVEDSCTDALPKQTDFRKAPRPIKCIHCTATFVRKKTLDAHVKQRHCPERESSSNVESKKEDKKYKEKSCPQCELTFASQTSLDKHAAHVHHGQFKYTCPICNHGCLSRPQFTMHISETHKESDMTDEDKEKIRKIMEGGSETEAEAGNKESCPFCEKKITIKGFYGHLRKHHPNQPWSEPSAVKDDVFTSLKTQFNENVRLYSKGNYICDHCGGKFTCKYGLSKHLRFQHEKKFDVSCDICGKGMRGDFQLRLHRARSHKIGNVSLVSKKTCTFEGCGRVSYSLEGFEDHLSTHTKTPRHQCNQCGAMSYSRKNLRRHQETHLENRPRPYKCEICFKTFARKDYLPYHMKTHDKQYNQTPEEEISKKSSEVNEGKVGGQQNDHSESNN